MTAANVNPCVSVDSLNTTTMSGITGVFVFSGVGHDPAAFVRDVANWGEGYGRRVKEFARCGNHSESSLFCFF